MVWWAFTLRKLVFQTYFFNSFKLTLLAKGAFFVLSDILKICSKCPKYFQFPITFCEKQFKITLAQKESPVCFLQITLIFLEVFVHLLCYFHDEVDKYFLCDKWFSIASFYVNYKKLPHARYVEFQLRIISFFASEKVISLLSSLKDSVKDIYIP